MVKKSLDIFAGIREVVSDNVSPGSRWITELGLISIAFASFIFLALVVLLTLKQASYNGKVSSPAVNHACQQTSFLQPV
ncbi:hypothetical protein Q7012_004513 [Salmonella enterica]|nr:hypothetical protein [Salmonella enterica]